MAKLREIAKSILIALLALTAVYLAARTWASSGYDFAARSGFFARILEGNTAPAPLPAIEETAGGYAGSFELPQTIVLGLESGRYGVAADREELTRVFNSLRPILREVAESAGTPESADEAEWKNALGGQSAFFDFGVDLPQEVFAQDIGAKAAGFWGVSARFLALAPKDGYLALYCKNDAGSVTRALSTVRLISFSDLLKGYAENGVSYAFQLGADFERLRGEQAIGLKPPKTAVYRAENTFLNDGKYDDAAVSRLLEAYLFNPLIVRKYPTEAGEEVFVGDSGLLTLKEDGMAVYEASGRGIPISELVDGAEDGAYDMLNAARRLTQASNGLGGAARFTLRSIETANGVTTIVFGLEMNGVPLMDAGKFNYGVVEIKDGCVYSAAIRYLSLFAEEEAVTILPEKQAAAIAAGNQTELPFVLEKEDRKYRLARVFRDTEG